MRARVPLLNADDVIAGTFHAGDGLADPNGVVMGYVNGAKRLGVQASTDVTVTAIETKRHGVSGVQTSAGAIACEIIVNATGPWAAPISEMAGVPLPVTPVRRQILTTTPLPESAGRIFPFVIDFAQSLYFHREGEGILTGQSNPAEAPGFDESVDQAWEYAHMERRHRAAADLGAGRPGVTLGRPL